MPGARGAALVDVEGETVDYAGQSTPYAIRVAAAHWRIVLEHAREGRLFANTQTLAVRAARTTFVVYALPQGYALVIVLSAAAGLPSWRRGLPLCAAKLAEEAGWSAVGTSPRRGKGPADPRDIRWYPVDVVCDPPRRPSSVSVEQRTFPIEILGSIVEVQGVTATRGRGRALHENVRGWRVRVGNEEATLVREPGGLWYADQPLRGPPSNGTGTTTPRARAPATPPAPATPTSDAASEEPGTKSLTSKTR
jgi:hypothetical protein